MYRLKVSVADYEELKRLVFADLPKEAGALALAGVAECEGGTDVLVRRVVEIPRHLFRVQEHYRLEIAPQAISGLVGLCQANRLGAVLVHSHPEDIEYSASDDFGEGRIFATLRSSLEPDAPTASLLFYPGGIRGRVWLPGRAAPVNLDEVIVVGRQLHRVSIDGGRIVACVASPVYDRQVRAFGQEGQALLARTKVAIVGVGGTGSPVAEQLVRLGVRDVKLFDPDRFQSTNITRMYGTFHCPWWRRIVSRSPFKVYLLARHLLRINPHISVRPVPKNIVLESAARELRDRDVIFLCTDDHWGRSVVNQIAYQYLIPTINLGARVSAEDGVIRAAVGVVDVLRPGLPCLWCTQFLRADRIAAESMPIASRKQLEAERYVEGLDTPAPSVVSITTAVAGMAVSLFLQQMTDWMGPGGDVARLNYNVMDATVRRGRAFVPDKCVCGKSRGCGDLRPLPTLRAL